MNFFNRLTGKRANRRTGKRANGQSSMELTIALVMFLILFAGAVKLFAWLNGRMVRQQVEYEETRVDAAVWDRQTVTASSLSAVTKDALPLSGEDIVDDSAYPQLNIFE